MYYYDRPACMLENYYTPRYPQQMPETTQPMYGMNPTQMQMNTQTQMPMQTQMPAGQMVPSVDQLPTGIPGGPITGDILNPEDTVMNKDYTQGYLKTQIGKRVKVEFVVGTDMFIDKDGILEDVGASYIILKDTQGNNQLCDMYSIKFVTFFEGPAS